MAYNDYNNGYNNNNYSQGYDGYGNYNSYDNSYPNNQYPYDNSGYGYGTSGYDQTLYGSTKIISNEAYNLVIGGVLLYGFIVNCIMTACFSNAITHLIIDNPIIFYISYFILAIAGSIMVKKSDNPVVSFLGYNLIVVPIGLVISFTVTAYTGFYGSSIVTSAFAITAIVTFIMMCVSSIFPNVFLRMGRTLGITLLVTVLTESIMMLVLGSYALPIIDYIVVAIFCLYIGYDWAKANAVPKTVDNAIDSACELYLDIANLFLRIMRILARANRN